MAFTDSSTSYDGIVSWLWDFGDGITSAEQNPTHIYTQNGTYTVALTVTEGDSDSDTDIQTGCISVVPDTTSPVAPTLLSPAAGATIMDSTPWLDWADVTDPSAVHYQIQVDTDAGFGSLVFSRTWVNASSCVVTTVLPEGLCYWRVRTVDGVGNASPWTAARSMWIDTSAPSVPALASPADGGVTADNTPWLDWSDVTDPSTVHHQVQVDTDAGFGSPAFSRTWVNASSCVVTTVLPDGVYYWRVRTVDGAGNASPWTAARSMWIDSSAPYVPALKSPSNGGVTHDSTPWLDWTDVTDSRAVHYQIQVDDEAGFTSPVFSRAWVNSSSCVVTAMLPDGVYYWRVRAIDAAGNASAWTGAWSFTVAN